MIGLGILLLVVWLVLWLGFHIVTGLVHLLVVVGLIALVWGFVKRGGRAIGNRV